MRMRKIPPGRRSSSHLGDLVGLGREPALQMLGVGERLPHQVDRRVERTFQHQVEVVRPSFFSVALSWFQDSLRSGRRALPIRRAARRSRIRRPTAPSVPAARSAHGPFFSDRTSPLSSSALRCWSTPGRLMLNGCASSDTDAGPRLSRASIPRRTGSDSAWNARSRLDEFVKHMLKYRARAAVSRHLSKSLNFTPAAVISIGPP